MPGQKQTKTKARARATTGTPASPCHRSACSHASNGPITPTRAISSVLVVTHVIHLTHAQSHSHTLDTQAGRHIRTKHPEKKKGEHKKRGTEPIPSLPPLHFLSILIQIHPSAHRPPLRRKSPIPPSLPPSPFPSSLLPRHVHRGGRQVAPAPAVSRDDTGSHRVAEREGWVEQVGDLQVHRGQVRRHAANARFASDGASGAHEGVRRAPLPQEQLLPNRRARRAAQARPRTPAQGQGPQRAKALLRAPPRTPAQGQGPRRRSCQPAQEAQGRPCPCPCGRRIHARQARSRPSPQGTPCRADGGLTVHRSKLCARPLLSSDYSCAC